MGVRKKRTEEEQRERHKRRTAGQTDGKEEGRKKGREKKKERRKQGKKKGREGVWEERKKGKNEGKEEKSTVMNIPVTSHWMISYSYRMRSEQSVCQDLSLTHSFSTNLPAHPLSFSTT